MSVFFILAMVFAIAAVPMLVLSVTQRRRSPWLSAGVTNLVLALLFAAVALFMAP